MRARGKSIDEISENYGVKHTAAYAAIKRAEAEKEKAAK
jgi:predicted DNA-binding protein YlxM (UPF0122 family)